jgi:hypothetical protein
VAHFVTVGTNHQNLKRSTNADARQAEFASDQQETTLNIPQPSGDMRSDEGDTASDDRLSIARHFADAIALAARQNMTRREQGRLVSTISALTRANLEIGQWRRAA